MYLKRVIIITIYIYIIQEYNYTLHRNTTTFLTKKVTFLYYAREPLFCFLAKKPKCGESLTMKKEILKSAPAINHQRVTRGQGGGKANDENRQNPFEDDRHAINRVVGM